MGSRGDVQPFIAIALDLINKGHDAVIIAPENFKDYVEGFNVSFRPVSTNAEKSIQTPEILKLLKTGNILRFISHINKITAETAPQLNKEIVAWTLDCDFLIAASLTSFMALCIGEKYNKPVGMVFLSMPITPTREFPHAIFGRVNLGWLNKATYKLNSLLWLSFKGAVTGFRKSLGLPYKNMMGYLGRSNTLTLYPMSKHLLTKPKDWVSNTHVTGFLSLPPDSRANHFMDKLPDGFEAWLKAGDQPIYIGFGSIPIPDPVKLVGIMMEILNTTDHRILFCIGWSVIAEIPQHKNLFVVPSVNHDRVLPLCKVAIIHGGIGTVGAVIKSKIPVIIVSILADQPYNGKMVEQLKIGVHIPFKTVNTQKLLKAIALTQTEEYKRNAETLGEKINMEDGAAECVEIMEAYFNR